MHSPSDLTLLLAQVVVILGVARALHWAIGRRVGQPLVVSEIAAGVVLFAFLVGLELDPTLLRERARVPVEQGAPAEVLLQRLSVRPPDLLVVGASKFWGVTSSGQRPMSLLARTPVPTLVVRSGDGSS